MDYVTYYRNNQTFRTTGDYRLRRMVQLVERLAPASLLDVGCGGGQLLQMLRPAERLRGTRFTAIDVYAAVELDQVPYVTGDITGGLPFRAGAFECVVLGEVIEHVPHPDFVLREIHRVLRPGGHLVISTPNLLSWANRILVVLGIQPFYTETSSERKMGRYFKALGQGSVTQGHLKVFGAPALQEILEYTGYQVVERQGTPFTFPQPLALVDQLLNRVVPLASGLLYVARKRAP